GGVHTHLKVRFESLAVLPDHAFDAKLLQTFGSRRHADQSPAMLGHEINPFRSDEFGSQDQIALVLPIGIVHNDHHFTGLDVGNHRFNGVELLPHKSEVS